MSTPSARPSTAALGTLLASGLATGLLAIYQWTELLVIRHGGKVACSVNETVNCAAVWNSKFASAVHQTLGMPIAGLGVVWGLAAAAFAVLLWKKASSEDAPVYQASVKLWAFGGLLSIVAFALASFEARAVCLTCLGTYGLVLVYGAAAFVMLPKPRWPDSKYLLGGAAWTFVVGAPTFLMALVPGSNTPKAGEVTKVAGTTVETLLDGLHHLPPREAMMTSAARKKWLTSPLRDVKDFKVRTRHGAADAPIQIVEFSDVLCPHCASFEEALEEIRGAVPKDMLSIEPRLFPLVDDGCRNPAEPDSPKAIRCVGAKAELCSEDHPMFWEVRKQLFANQQSLRSSAMVLQIVSKVTGRSAEALMACINSPETAAKLADDIAYATRYELKATPMVLLNGRETWPAAGFIVGMALSKGDVNAEYFKKLPEPPPDEEDDEHAHGH